METVPRRLLFRIASARFSLALGDLVEIQEHVAEHIDFDKVDHDLFVVGALPFRRTMIPIYGLAERLDFESTQRDIALVLNSPEGNWALLVDRVEGFYPETDFIDRPVSRLLKSDGWRCFNEVSLLKGVPYLKLELPACYHGGF